MTEQSNYQSMEVLEVPAEPDPQFAEFSKVPKKRVITEQEKHEGWQRSIAWQKKHIIK